MRQSTPSCIDVWCNYRDWWGCRDNCYSYEYPNEWACGEQHRHKMATKTSKLPFEQLPNLPPPVIPVVDLRTEPVRWDLVPREHAAVAESRYSGQYYADQSCQTYESELGDVKQVSQVLEELSEVTHSPVLISIQFL